MADAQMLLEEICHKLRTDIKNTGDLTHVLLSHSDFDIKTETYTGQHNEMKANIMLAYRHLENARMRIGKILQTCEWCGWMGKVKTGEICPYCS